jgi:hypothetical protein
VVIIGYSKFGSGKHVLTDYQYRKNTDGITEEIGTSYAVEQISPYLVEGNEILINSRSSPLCSVPKSIYGSKPVDGSYLIVEEVDREAFLQSTEFGAKYLRPLLCADEFINNIPRWCLWLVDANPTDLRNDKAIIDRVQSVRDFRLASKKGATQEAAKSPTIFAEIRQPTSNFIVIPQHTSERRKYIPIGFFTPEYIVHNSCTAIPDASQYHFGILSSVMHNSWLSRICGRIKSDYRYSAGLVYNNFPWPQQPTDKQIATVEAKAQAVLDARAVWPTSSLADLYDPNTMPPNLRKAHDELDKAVEQCYRKEPFKSDRDRVEFLFTLYEKLTNPLTASVKNEKPKRKRKQD